MFHTAVYSASAATAGATNFDFSAVTDSVFVPRNSHLMFTVPMKLGKIMVVGANPIRGRFQVPTWNAVTEFDILNVNRSATVPSNPQYDDYLAYPPDIPLNEEFQVQVSNNLGAATEQETAILQLMSADWSPIIPRGGAGFLPFVLIQATFTVTPTVNAWSGPQTITLVSNLRNGVYSVVGATLQGTNSAAFRFFFPTQRPYAGKFFRPGGPVQNAIGDTLSNQRTPAMVELGEWGRFHSLELPQVEVFGLTASSTTYRLFFWCVYLGTDQNQLYSWAAQGSTQQTM